jgi:hypothetical protein
MMEEKEKVLKKLSNEWTHIAVRAEYQDLFDFDDFVKVFNETYNLIKEYATAKAFDRGVVKLSHSMRNFYLNDKIHATKIVYVAQMVTMLLCEDILFPICPLEVAPTKSPIFYKKESHYFDFENVKESIEECVNKNWDK